MKKKESKKKEKLTKKEYRNKCRNEKSKSYMFILRGLVLSTIGLVIVLISVFLIKNISIQLVFDGVGAGLAIIGMIFDIIGEVKISNEFKELSK